MYNDVMNLSYASYGFLSSKEFPLPFELLDLGLEWREGETYHFRNTERSDYVGYLLQYTLSGKGIYREGTQEYLLEEGDAFLIHFPNDSSYYLPSKEEGHWEFIYLHFNGSGVETLYDEINKRGTLLHLDGNRSSILYFFQKLQELQKGLRFSLYEESSWLYTFLTSLLRDLHTPNPFKKSSLVQEAQFYLEANFADEISINQMAQELQVSPPHLTREFHTHFGQAPIRYLTRLRIEHAIRLLLNSTLDVKKVAKQCGFQSSNYFTKVFHKEVGLSPSRYRELHH